MCYPLYHLPLPPGHWKITLGVLFNLYILNSSLFCAFLFFSSVFSCSSILVFSSFSWYPFHNSFLLFLNLWLSQKHHFHKCIVIFKRNAIEFQVYGYFTCMYTWATFVCLVPAEARKRTLDTLGTGIKYGSNHSRAGNQMWIVKFSVSQFVGLDPCGVLNNPVAGIT